MPFDQDSVLAAASAAPRLDPSSAVGIGSTTNDPSIAAQNAQAAAANARAVTAVNVLRRSEPSVQRKQWDLLDDATKQMYQAAGYQPPAAPRSILSSVVDYVGGVASGALKGSAAVPVNIVKGGLYGLGAGLRATQHAYRAAEAISDQSGPVNFDAKAWANAFDISQWARGWRQTEHGERSFLPSHDRAIVAQYGPDTAGLAKRLASGEPADAIILSYPQDQRQDVAQRLNDSADIRAATEQYREAKMSFGRSLTPDSLWRTNHKLATVMSGGLDATYDIAADPVVWGGKTAKAVQTLPYVVDDATRLGEILAKPGAQRMITAASDALSEGPSQLARRFPKFAPIAQQLIDEGVDSPEKMTEWFQGQAGKAAILDGRVGGFAPKAIGATGPMVPHISTGELTAEKVKDVASRVIDWTSDSKIPLARPVARSIDRISNLVVPVGDKIDPHDPTSLTYLQRIADYALPRARADEIVNTFAHAEEGQQYNIYKGLLGEVMDGMNVPQSYKDQFFSRLDDARAVVSYGTNDSMLLDSGPTKAGFTVAQVADHGWSVPDYRAMRAAADKGAVLNALYGTVNSDTASGFMRIWKPAQLLRLGFPIRTAGEEMVAAMLRDGPVGLIRARLAESALKAPDEPMVSVHPFDAILDRLTRNLPEPVQNAINTPSELAGAVIGNRTRRAMRFVEGRLAGERYLNAAEKIARLYPDALPEEISAVEQHGAGFLTDAPTLTRMGRDGVEGRPMLMTATGEFKDYTPTEKLYANMWQKRLDDYTRDPLMQAAFEHATAGEDEQIRAVTDAIDNLAPSVRKQAVRYSTTIDGRVVGVDATQDEATRDWAKIVADNANHVTSDATGRRFDDILAAVRAGKPVDIETLNAIPEDIRPSTVSGPDVMPTYGDSKWGRFQTWGFEHIGRMMNWIAREPMFVHNMALSLDEVEPFRAVYGAAGATAEHVDQQLAEVAAQRALNRTIPFIHDPKIRSQFAEDARNLMPFQFAQEQFIKRWARTAAYSPESFRKAQLAMMGLRHSGFVHTDPTTGQDYFMYPGADLAQGALTKAWKLVSGHDVSLPLPVGFSGQVRFATPGTERLGAPSFGPLVAIPMHALATRFPELSGLEQQVLGDRGAGRSYWEQVVPASVARLVHITDNPESSPQMLSATVQAIKYLEATGHGLADEANPAQQEQYIDRVKSWARILMVNRAIYGYAAPASPQAELDPGHLNAEFTTLLGEMPIEHAVAEFIRRHPNATPYTVFATKSASGGPLPSTQAALDFMDGHGDFLKKYPQAASWFLPQTAQDFSLPAYREQLALGLRDRKNASEFYADVKFAEAAPDYFDTRDARDQALANAKGNSALTRQINQQWSDFSKPYLASHPIFEDQLTSNDGRERRKNAITQLRQAFEDPSVPSTPQNAAMKDMVDTYDAYTSYIGQYSGRSDRVAVDERRVAKQQFVDWAHGFVAEHPEVQGLYNSVFRLEVGD